MSTALMSAAAALLLAGVEPATRRRLAWLAGERLPGTSSSPRGRLPGRPGRWALLGLAPIGWLAGPVPGILCLLTTAVLGWCARVLARERSAARAVTSLAGIVAALAAEHAAGAPLAAAFERVAATADGVYRQPLADAGRLGQLGGEPANALAGKAGLTRVAVAAELVSRSGVAAGDVLRRVGADLAAEQRVRLATNEAVAGPRSSAVLLAVLPGAGIAMGVVLGARPFQVLLHTPLGQAVLTAGVLLDLAGLIWTLRLTAARAAARPVPPGVGSR